MTRVNLLRPSQHVANISGHLSSSFAATVFHGKGSARAPLLESRFSGRLPLLLADFRQVSSQSSERCGSRVFDFDERREKAPEGGCANAFATKIQNNATEDHLLREMGRKISRTCLAGLYRKNCQI